MELTWAGKRKAIVITIFSLIGLTIISGVAISVFYKVPSCTDKKQNQEEVGIDCGGSCSALCLSEVQPATVRFARALQSSSGRTDFIAYIDNPNKSAGVDQVEAIVELYGNNHALLYRKEVTLDLPPATSVPLYIPNILQKSDTVTQTFLTLRNDSFTWIKAVQDADSRPTVDDIMVQETETPRIVARLNNNTAYPVADTTLVVTVFDSSGNAIAASKTLVPTLSPQGTAPLVFTWNLPFPAPVARVEILPLQEVFPQGP